MTEGGAPICVVAPVWANCFLSALPAAGLGLFVDPIYTSNEIWPGCGVLRFPVILPSEMVGYRLIFLFDSTRGFSETLL